MLAGPRDTESPPPVPPRIISSRHGSKATQHVGALRCQIWRWGSQLGPDHPDVASSLSNRHQAIGKLKQALPQPATVPLFELALGNHAMLYVDMGQHMEALPLLAGRHRKKFRTAGSRFQAASRLVNTPRPLWPVHPTVIRVAFQWQPRHSRPSHRLGLLLGVSRGAPGETELRLSEAVLRRSSEITIEMGLQLGSVCRLCRGGGRGAGPRRRPGRGGPAQRAPSGSAVHSSAIIC
jgi:hypothetical protein